MWKVIAFLIALTACGFPRPADVNPGNDSGGQPGDGGVDSGPDAKTCIHTTCTDGLLEVCGASGTVEHSQQCILSCFSDETRCNEFVPSNGLGSALDRSAQQAAMLLPAGAIVNTDTGAVTTQLGTPIQVTTLTVAQPGGAIVRALLAQSWTINDVRILGTLPVAFVSSDEIKVQGIVDASADGEASGSGALTCDSASGGGGVPGGGLFVRQPSGSSPGYPTFLWIVNGFGGGGFGTAGGAGGLTDSNFAVGAAGPVNGNAELIPLRGGCQGGGRQDGNDQVLHRGGGGGAIQLVSGRAVHLLAGGVAYVGGGGGVAGALGATSLPTTNPIYGPAGGGSGGGILIEAPIVAIDDGATLLATGGGGGGYGACNPGPDGADAAPNASIPAGGGCPVGTNPAAVGGAGATTGNGADGGATVATDRGQAGSGGGGLGRIRINTVDGLYMISVNALVRGATTSGRVGFH